MSLRIPTGRIGFLSLRLPLPFREHYGLPSAFVLFVSSDNMPKPGAQGSVSVFTPSGKCTFSFRIIVPAASASRIGDSLSALAVPHTVLSTSGDWLRPFAAFLGARR